MSPDPGTSSKKSLSSGSRQERWAQNLWEDGISPSCNTPHCVCEGPVVNSLDVVDIGEEVLGRAQLESGREEVNNRET